jgi:ferredoxin
VASNLLLHCRFIVNILEKNTILRTMIRQSDDLNMPRTTIKSLAGLCLFSILGGCVHYTVAFRSLTTITTHPPTLLGTQQCRSSSTQIFEKRFFSAQQGVDRNQYNIPVDRIAQEWTAELIPGNSLLKEGVYLGAKSSKELSVDTVLVELSRRKGEGLGLSLLEIAGGREDGLGITVVDGIVEGGISDGSDVLIGDSIAAITVIKKTTTDTSESSSLSEQEVRHSVETECLGYDKTVEAILSLPSVESDSEKIILTLKRLRRKAKVIVNLQYPPSQGEPDATLELFAGENLRRAMLTRGVKLNDPLSRRFDSGGTGDCGGEATCSTCVVSVMEGADLFDPQRSQEQQMLVKNPRWRLACKAIVGYGDREGTITVRVNPRQWDDYR